MSAMHNVESECCNSWWNNLSQYNIKLTHVPGSKLIQADALSRRSDHVTGEDDETIVMLPENMFISLIATDLRDKIASATNTDELAMKIKNCLHKRLPPPMRTSTPAHSTARNSMGTRSDSSGEEL